MLFRSHDLDDHGLDSEARRVIAERLDELWRRIEAEPKSSGWRLRSRVGDRMKWFDEPEENPQGR